MGRTSLEIINHSNGTTIFYANDDLILSIKSSPSKWYQRIKFTDTSHYEINPYESKLLAQLTFRGFFYTFKSSLKVDWPEQEELHNLVLHYRVWKSPLIRFRLNGSDYLVVFHRGSKYSFFKNDQQFGYLTSKALVLGSHRKYQVVANDQESTALLCIITYMILLIREDSYNDESDFTMDFGNLGPQFRKFDQNWNP